MPSWRKASYRQCEKNSNHSVTIPKHKKHQIPHVLYLIWSDTSQLGNYLHSLWQHIYPPGLIFPWYHPRSLPQEFRVISRPSISCPGCHRHHCCISGTYTPATSGAPLWQPSYYKFCRTGRLDQCACLYLLNSFCWSFTQHQV